MKKKVLFLITKSNWGGAQRYVYDIATSLDADRYEPVVVLGGAGELIEKLSAANVRVIPLESLQRDMSITKELQFMSELWRLLHQERPDILHVNSSKAGGVGCFLGRLAGIPRVIFTAHGWAFNEDRSGIQRFVIAYLHWLTVFLSHQTIAVSAELKNQLRGPFLSRRWAVIHNGRHAIPFLNRDDARAHLALPDDAFVTGSIGELHPTKQHDVMIRAVAKLVTAGHGVHHVIIGTGELHAQLQSLIEELHLEPYITLAGAIDEAARYLPAFDVYVQPSRSEALGYTVVEAAQAGLPIIASNVGGLPEIITHEVDGLLVPSGDVTALADAVTTLLHSPTLRDTYAAAAQETSARFSFDHMLTQTLAVYEDKMSSPGSDASRASD